MAAQLQAERPVGLEQVALEDPAPLAVAKNHAGKSVVVNDVPGDQRRRVVGYKDSKAVCAQPVLKQFAPAATEERHRFLVAIGNGVAEENWLCATPHLDGPATATLEVVALGHQRGLTFNQEALPIAIEGVAFQGWRSAFTRPHGQLVAAKAGADDPPSGAAGEGEASDRAVVQ